MENINKSEIEKLTNETKSLFMAVNHKLNPKDLKRTEDLKDDKKDLPKFSLDSNDKNDEKDPYHKGDDKDYNKNNSNDSGEKSRNDRVKYSADEQISSISIALGNIEANMSKIKSLGGETSMLESMYQKLLDMKQKAEQEKAKEQDKDKFEEYCKIDWSKVEGGKTGQERLDHMHNCAKNCLIKMTSEEAKHDAFQKAEDSNGNPKYNQDFLESQKKWLAYIKIEATEQLNSQDADRRYIVDFQANNPPIAHDNEKNKENDNQQDSQKNEEQKEENNLNIESKTDLMEKELENLNKELESVIEKEGNGKNSEELSVKIAELNIKINSEKSSINKDAEFPKTTQKSLDINKLAELRGTPSKQTQNIVESKKINNENEEMIVQPEQKIVENEEVEKFSDKQKITALRDGTNLVSEGKKTQKIKHDFNKVMIENQSQNDENEKKSNIVHLHASRNLRQTG